MHIHTRPRACVKWCQESFTVPETNFLITSAVSTKLVLLVIHKLLQDTRPKHLKSLVLLNFYSNPSVYEPNGYLQTYS